MIDLKLESKYGRQIITKATGKDELYIRIMDSQDAILEESEMVKLKMWIDALLKRCKNRYYYMEFKDVNPTHPHAVLDRTRDDLAIGWFAKKEHAKAFAEERNMIGGGE